MAETKQTRLTTTQDTDEVGKLREENARLKAELVEAKRNQKAQPNTKPEPKEPSYKLSEGQRDELERTGKTVSPFTGARQMGTGKDDVKQVSAEEFAKTPAKNEQ